jgi:DeoR/GlpR family transcriptional regulator of sugar metabolism
VIGLFKAERLQKIREMVCEQKQVDVATLSKMLNVTEVTIRSDLEQLEKSGFLKRLHGGAVLNESASASGGADDPLRVKTIAYDKARETAAKIAAGLVRENDHIFIGPGETCYYIAKELVHARHLTVLTNNLYVANVLASHTNVTLIVTGGRVWEGRYCVAGDLFSSFTENFFVTKSFFSVAGVNLSAGYTVSSGPEVTVFHEMKARSRQIVIAADSSKFDNISFVKLCGLETPLALATDAPPPKPYADYYKQHGIEVLAK